MSACAPLHCLQDVPASHSTSEARRRPPREASLTHRSGQPASGHLHFSHSRSTTGRPNHEFMTSLLLLPPLAACVNQALRISAPNMHSGEWTTIGSEDAAISPAPVAARRGAALVAHSFERSGRAASAAACRFLVVDVAAILPAVARLLVHENRRRQRRQEQHTTHTTSRQQEEQQQQRRCRQRRQQQRKR